MGPRRSKTADRSDVSTTDAVPLLDESNLLTPALESTELRMSYRIARGEQGVLTFEPYKSILLPFWRFKTVAIATASSEALFAAFRHYVTVGDFVGADMARKFVQMGMTRARRYANYAGGRKYNLSEREVAESGGGERHVLPKSAGHAGQTEKAQASEIFKTYWKRCREDAEYVRLKSSFLKEQKQWDKTRRSKS